MIRKAMTLLRQGSGCIPRQFNHRLKSLYKSFSSLSLLAITFPSSGQRTPGLYTFAARIVPL